MKILISNDFKALRHGEFVTASEDSGEFIFDSLNNKLASATLLEIAIANKIPLKKGKIGVMVSNLETELINLGLREQNEMSNTDKVREIVLNGFENGSSDDTMLIEIVKSGIPFKNAGKMFRFCVEESGLRLSNKKRAEEIDEILEENEFYPETFDEVQAMSERIAIGDSEKQLEAVADTTTTQAMKAIKNFLKEKEIEFPKPPKKIKGSLRDRYLKFSVANPQASDEELSTWYLENAKDKNDSDAKKWSDRYLIFVNYARAMSQNCIDNEVSPFSREEVVHEADESQED